MSEVSQEPCEEVYVLSIALICSMVSQGPFASRGEWAVSVYGTCMAPILSRPLAMMNNGGSGRDSVYR